MVERTLHSRDAGVPVAPLLSAGPAPGVVYGITALRYQGSQIVEAMMGLVDPGRGDWDIQPAPTRLVEVVDRLVEGDTVISLFADELGTLRPGPQVKVDVLPEGTETLALADDAPGHRLQDLPRF